MVKGVSKRVVVVRPRDNEIFEEAIFIVRGTASAEGRTQEDILKEAYRVAEGYTHIKRAGSGILNRIPAPVYTAAGALLVGAAWFVSTLI